MEFSSEDLIDILGISPSPIVGRAYQYLLDLRMDRGPLGEEVAKAELLNWWSLNKPKI